MSPGADGLRDPLLCPGDGCRGCFHCYDDTGETDADRATEPGRDLESSTAAALSRLEGEYRAVVQATQAEPVGGPPGVVGRTRDGVTGCSTVLGEIGVLRACADALNETAATSSPSGGINALSWEDALHALDGLRLAVETLAQIDSALVRHAYLVCPHGDTEVPGIGVVSVRRSNERRAWDHESWQDDARAALLDKKNVPAYLYDAEGNEHDVFNLLRDIEAIHGAAAPKVTALRALGLDDAAYCEVQPGKPQVQITRSSK